MFDNIAHLCQVNCGGDCSKGSELVKDLPKPADEGCIDVVRASRRAF